MRSPRAQNGWFDRSAKFLYRCYQYKLCRYLIAPIILAFPPGFLTSYYSNSTFAETINKSVPAIGANIEAHPVIWVLFSMIYPSLILIFAKIVLSRAHARKMTDDWLHHLNVALDRVVGCKNVRFTDHVLSMDDLTRENAFCTITQPETQIAELVRGICEFFNAIRAEDKNVNDRSRLIRVTLCLIIDGNVESILISYPEDEATIPPQSVALLNDPSSCIQTSIRERDIVVIQSIESELKKAAEYRRFVDIGVEGDNYGSLICYPVIYRATGDIPYVVTIHCDEDGYFREKKSELYKFSLDRFSLRVRLEHNLLLMKETLCEP